MEDTAGEVHRVGHRRFVGGQDEFWDLIGELQFRFLVERGLAPSDILVDIGCGSLRAGTRFIRYLEPAHYLGMDKHIDLIIYGVAEELGVDEFRRKQPRLLVSDSFEFQKLAGRPTFGIAQSLFTHLAAHDIDLCLSRLRPAAAPGCRLFATFFETPSPVSNPSISQSDGYFAYTRQEMEAVGVRNGFTPHYIGAWNHPREQHMIEYVAG